MEVARDATSGSVTGRLTGRRDGSSSRGVEGQTGSQRLDEATISHLGAMLCWQVNVNWRQLARRRLGEMGEGAGRETEREKERPRLDSSNKRN